MPRSHLVRATASALLAAAIVAALASWGLRADDAPEPQKPALTLTFQDEGDSDTEAAVRATLGRHVSLDISEMPLRKFFNSVKQECHIPISVHEQAILDEGVSLDTPVTKNLSRVSLKSALAGVLEPLQLRAVVREGALHFTTAAEAVNLRTTHVYNVSDLIPDGDESRHRLDALLTTIEESTGGEPDGPWPDNLTDGAHAIYTSRIDGATLLVIEQTDATHEEISQLLHALRAALRQRAILPVP